VKVGDSWDKNGLTALTVKQAELGLGTIVSCLFSLIMSHIEDI
jgi:hypothetical protein